CSPPAWHRPGAGCAGSSCSSPPPPSSRPEGLRPARTGGRRGSRRCSRWWSFFRRRGRLRAEVDLRDLLRVLRGLEVFLGLEAEGASVEAPRQAPDVRVVGADGVVV